MVMDVDNNIALITIPRSSDSFPSSTRRLEWICFAMIPTLIIE